MIPGASWRRPWLAAALVVLSPAAPCAAEALTFNEAIALTSTAPEVKSAETVLEVRRAEDRRISGQTGSPTLTLQPGMRVAPESERGFEGQAQLVHSWNLAGLADARRRSAAAERRALAVRLQAAALLQRLEAARAWLELRTITEAQAVVRKELATAEQSARTVARAVDAGVLTRAALSDAQATAAAAERKALAVEAEWVAAQLALASATGRTDPEDLRVAGPPPEPGLPALPRLKARFARSRRFPDVVATRLEAVAERAHEAEAAAPYGTQMQAGVQVQRESPDGYMVFGVVSLTFPIADLAARQRSEARARAVEREGAHRRASQAALREVADVLHEVEHARQEERILKRKIVPNLKRLVEEREAQVKAGEEAIFGFLDTQRRLREAEYDAVRAEGLRRWAEMRAWLLLAAVEAPAGDS